MHPYNRQHTNTIGKMPKQQTVTRSVTISLQHDVNRKQFYDPFASGQFVKSDDVNVIDHVRRHGKFVVLKLNGVGFKAVIYELKRTRRGFGLLSCVGYSNIAYQTEHVLFDKSPGRMNRVKFVQIKLSHFINTVLKEGNLVFYQNHEIVNRFNGVGRAPLFVKLSANIEKLRLRIIKIEGINLETRLRSKWNSSIEVFLESIGLVFSFNRPLFVEMTHSE